MVENCLVAPPVRKPLLVKNVNYFSDKAIIRKLSVAFTDRAGLYNSKEISIKNFQIFVY
jgi:hypothetical protein